MSTQIFYPTDPLDGSIAPDSIFMGNEFPTEFLSLAALDKHHHHPEMAMPSMQFAPHNSGPDTLQQMTPGMQGRGESEEMRNRPRLRNRALRPAPRDMRKESMDMGAGIYPIGNSFSSFSSNSNASIDHDADFTFDNEHTRASPHSDLSSKSTSPLRWHTGTADTEKRAKHLERNRAAASKSRQKKKRETDQLRTRFNDASRRKSSLEVEIKELHSQLLSLKDQILMHSRCDDEAIRMYLGRMVKQATRQGSVSSASSGEADEDRARRHSRCQGHAGSVSPTEAKAAHLRTTQRHNSEMDVSESQEMPLNMGNPSLPCGVEKPMLDQMFTQPEGNIFDLQMSVS